ncbi:alpha/beta hydrolase [Ideonella livida]|uniref:Alpha/beta hydrolase n=1 Tax=Ideonella livida TaxID=2707176 RepID=A0A7C9TM38_9BURK|nr:alpha/beta hydrolase [Ideonella livida]NDY93022.1 alpha/beta hydrolase [Ideonella livida]
MTSSPPRPPRRPRRPSWPPQVGRALRAGTLGLGTTLAACGGGSSQDAAPPPPVQAPATGLYMATQFSVDQLTEHTDLVYATRANPDGDQYTAGNRRAAETGAETLALRLDLSMPPNAVAGSPQPLVIWVHGGGFQSGSKEDFRAEMRSYAQAGYVAASINYRLTPDNARSPARRLQAITQASEDLMDAIRFLKSRAGTYHLDVQRIATLGSSAGGGMALINAVEPDTLAGTQSGVPRQSARVRAAVSTGATLVEGNLDTGSLLRVDPDDTPVLLLHANPTDRTTGATWSGHLLPTQARFTAAGVRCDVVAQPDMSHVVDLSVQGPWWEPVRRFLWTELDLAALPR